MTATVIFVLICTHLAALVLGAAIAAYLYGQSLKLAVDDIEGLSSEVAHWRSEANSNALTIQMLRGQLRGKDAA